MIRFDHKIKWKEAADKIYNGLYRWGVSNDVDLAQRIKEHREGYYETPKTYVDGVAYNDGSWHIYNTCWTKNGKVTTKIKCMSRNTLIRYIYGYVCFLKSDGITDRREMFYYTIKFIRERLIIPQGMFEYNYVNKKFLEGRIDFVLASDIDDDFKDSRNYAFEPGITGRLTREDYTRLQRMVQKEYKDRMIEKYYDSSLSVEQNLTVMNEAGLQIKKSRLYIWLKTQK